MVVCVRRHMDKSREFNANRLHIERLAHTVCAPCQYYWLVKDPCVLASMSQNVGNHDNVAISVK